MQWLPPFDRILQQLVLQGESAEDVDVTPLQINVKEIVQLWVFISFLFGESAEKPGRVALTSNFFLIRQIGHRTRTAGGQNQSRRFGEGKLRSGQLADPQGAGTGSEDAGEGQ